MINLIKNKWFLIIAGVTLLVAVGVVIYFIAKSTCNCC